MFNFEVHLIVCVCGGGILLRFCFPEFSVISGVAGLFVCLFVCVPRAPHCSRMMCKVSTDFSTCVADVAV